MFGEILLILFPHDKGPEICRETVFATDAASAKSGECPTPLVLTPWKRKGPLGRLRSLVWQGVSSLLEIPTDSCHFFCTPGNPCATPIATRGEGSFSYQGVSTRGVRRLVAHDCGYPLSRYTCRATRVAADFLDFIAFCRCSTGVALHPLKILVSHLPPPLCREVSHRNLGLKRCRATRGCRSYSCGCRATLCN